MVALRTAGLRELRFDEELLALRLLTDRREELAKLRVQTVNRLHRLLTELIPGGANKRDLSALQAKRLLATVKPRTLLRKTTRRMVVEEIADLVAVDAKLKAMKKELRAAVLARGSHLMDLFGVGPAVAARVLADVGDVARFPDRNHFASWTGTAPLDASSGEQIRHRLSRAGNRRMNHVIHIAAIVQIRHDTPGRAYYRRKLAQSKTAMEALRCLKRRISDAIYRQLLADAGLNNAAAAGVAAPPAEAGPGGHSGASSRSSAADLSTPVIGSSEQPLPGPATPTLPPPAVPANPHAGSAPQPPRRRTIQDAETALLTQRGTRSARADAHTTRQFRTFGQLPLRGPARTVEFVKLTAIWAGVKHDLALRLGRIDEPEGYFPAWDPTVPTGTSSYRPRRRRWWRVRREN